MKKFSASRMRCRRRRAGFALLLVLLAVVALGAMLSIDQTNSMYDAAMTRQLSEITRDRLTLISAANITASILRGDDPLSDSLTDSWAGQLPSFTLNGRKVSMRISDERSKMLLSPNGSGDGLPLPDEDGPLARSPVELSGENLRAFLAPRPEMAPSGADSSDLPLEPSFHAFYSYWSDGKVNVNTATFPALKAVLGDSGLCHEIIAARRLRPFESTKGLRDFLKDRGIRLHTEEYEKLAVDSSVFSVVINVEGPRKLKALAVLTRAGDGIRRVFLSEVLEDAS